MLMCHLAMDTEENTTEPPDLLAGEKSLSPHRAELLLRRPTAPDGAAVHRLIENCPPLDRNSLYCNLLQCSHFAASSALAELDGPGLNGNVVGFVSGHLLPDHPETLFVWQVAVAASMRGRRLGRDLILNILARPEQAAVRWIETTVTDDNAASWAMFKSLAASLETSFERSVLFDRDLHLAGQSPTENLMRIGPFDRRHVPDLEKEIQ